MAVVMYQIIKGMRSYDGSGLSSESWLTKFEEEVDGAGQNEKWEIQNIDRVLEGKVKSWWSGVCRQFEEGLNDANAGAR